MKNMLILAVSVACCVIFAGGCIPSTPPAEEEAPVQAAPPAPAPAVENAAPSAPEPAPVAVPAADTAAPAQEAAEGEDGKSNLQISLDSDTIPEGAIPLPIVSLVPIEGAKGYRIQSRFPVEGLSMEGTVMLTGPGKWVLSGQFKSDTDAFAPGEPTVQALGATEKGEDGLLKFTGADRSMMIFFPAPMPPADAPKLPQPKTIPFKFDFEAPDDAAFNIMLTPF